METKTNFDLTGAIDSWRRQLLAQGEILPAELRELESHLRSSIDGLNRLGLKEEESFLLACRRLGHGKPIAAEFAKAKPYRLWHNRLNWLTAGVMGAYVWTTSYSFFSSVLCKNWNFAGENGWLVEIMLFASIIGGLVWVTETRMRGWWRRIGGILDSPWRIAFGWLLVVVIGQVLAYVTSQYVARPSPGSDGGLILIGASIESFWQSLTLRFGQA
ncbi:MAG TPA: hypothetical protein VH595_05915 [Verrucomicrobiae bacterium]|jgi:hypothetical protein|nr:hypothetical protein [Verrucomicrobiae bacterium]